MGILVQNETDQHFRHFLSEESYLLLQSSFYTNREGKSRVYFCICDLLLLTEIQQDFVLQQQKKENGTEIKLK